MMALKRTCVGVCDWSVPVWHRQFPGVAQYSVFCICSLAASACRVGTSTFSVPAGLHRASEHAQSEPPPAPRVDHSGLWLHLDAEPAAPVHEYQREKDTSDTHKHLLANEKERTCDVYWGKNLFKLFLSAQCRLKFVVLSTIHLKEFHHHVVLTVIHSRTNRPLTS